MITFLYAGIMGFFLLALTFLVIKNRMKRQISFGDGGDTGMNRIIRSHANFLEYVPFALFLIFLVEYEGMEDYIVHALGIALITGRVLHAKALLRSPDKMWPRVMGTLLTLIVIFAAALLCLYNYVIV